MKDSKRFGLISASFFGFMIFHTSVLLILGQQPPRPTYNNPPELQATDPEIRTLLDETRSTCDQSNLGDMIERVQKALRMADSRGLVGDRALAEATLASAYIGQAEVELAFTTFQKALQDAIDSKNKVLEADILVSLSSEAQMKGNTLQAIDLISRALSISEKSRSFYVKARALGELGRMKLLLGKTDEAAQSIDEALEIDKLNGYRFEALHLVYRGYYLGASGKLDLAIDSVTQARAKAVAARDAYSFLMAEVGLAIGLVQKGRAEDAIAELGLVRSGELQKFFEDSKAEKCVESALALPVLHLTVLEGLAAAYRAANQKEKELEIWQESYLYSHDHSILAGEAEAAQRVADLNNQLKRTDDALKYYAIAVDLFRKLQNETLLNQAEVSQFFLLVQVGRGKEALPLVEEVASYARRHQLRSLEFGADLQLGQIYQPDGDLERARDALEKAQGLVQPGPFDSELDNHLVLQAYTRLGDIYKAQNVPTKELVAIDKAFFTALHLKDEKAQQLIVAYLDQRLGELRVRELVERRQKEGQLAESLLYSYILYIRDGFPAKPTDDQSNYQRILALPFQIAQSPGGATVLIETLGEIGPMVGFEKLPILNALARYYIAAGANPALAEKYALEAETVLKDLKGDMTALKVESSCVLAISYSRQGKNAMATEKIAECLSLAKKTNDQQTATYADAANAMVQAQTGNIAGAKAFLENLIAKTPDNPELHVELAMALANAKMYDEANSQLDFAVAKFISAGDRKTAAGAYRGVSIVLNLDSSERAHKLQLQYLNSAQRLFHDLQAWAEEAEALVALGDYCLKLSQTRPAIDNYDKAYDLAQKAGERDIVAHALLGLGNGYQSQKDFTRASEFHTKAAAAYNKLNNGTGETISLRILARDYFELGETDRALSLFLEAKRAAKNAPPLNEYFVDYALGGFYTTQGQFEKALVSFKEAVEITNQAGDLEHCAYSHLAIAGLNTVIGGWEDAISESEMALGLFQKIGNKEGQAACWAVLTGIYSDRSSSLKNFDKAQECYEKAQEFGYGKILQLDLMEVYLQTGKYAEAANIANESIQNCLKDANVDCQAHGLLSLSEAKRLGGDINAARSALNEARPLASKSQDLYLRGRLLYGEARQLTSERKLDEALASYKQLITLIEAIKGKLDAKRQKSLSENYGYIYDELVSLLYSMSKRDSRDQLGLSSESLEYAEINKARQFAESWGRAFISQMRRTLPADLQERERVLFSKRDRIRAQLDASETLGNPLGKNEKAVLEADLSAVEKDIASFLIDIRKASPPYASVAYPMEIQVSTLPLKKGETLVEFKMTDDATFVWLAQNPQGSGSELVSFYKIPQKRSWFLERISLLRGQVNTGNPDLVSLPICELLFKTLFTGEAEKIIAAAQELVIIPDDALFLLPFELYSPKASASDFVLIQKPITYYPSAVAFQLARAAGHYSGWPGALFGLADPITSPEDERYVITQVMPLAVSRGAVKITEVGNHQGDRPIDLNRLKSRGFSFERLPGTSIEIQSIAALLRKANEPVEVRVGAEATRQRLLDTDLSQFRFLHFATHGILPVDTNIKEPALVLSYDGISPMHMFLTMSDILNFKLRSESVVLSACNTGSGSVSRAEGVMSLGRAFLGAGASSVAVSLWQVSDESTALLMQEYYRRILEGKKKNVALAEARYTVFSKGQKAPFFWAPFILIGE